MVTLQPPSEGLPLKERKKRRIKELINKHTYADEHPSILTTIRWHHYPYATIKYIPNMTAAMWFKHWTPTLMVLELNPHCSSNRTGTGSVVEHWLCNWKVLFWWHLWLTTGFTILGTKSGNRTGHPSASFHSLEWQCWTRWTIHNMMMTCYLEDSGCDGLRGNPQILVSSSVPKWLEKYI